MVDASEAKRGSGSRLRRLTGLVRGVGGGFWAFVLLVLLTLFALRERGEVARIFHVLRAARPAWLVAAIVVGLGLQALIGLTLKPTLRRLGSPVGVVPLVRAQFQRLVIATVVPLGGPASMVTFIRALNAQGVATDDALYGMLLNSALGYVSFTIFIIPIIALLLAAGSASHLIEVATVALVLLLALILAGLVGMLRGSRRLHWLESRLPERVRVFVESARTQGVGPRDLLPALLIHLGVEGCGVLMLYLSLRAVRVSPGVETVFVGYAVGTLFYLVSPVFQGLGAVELSMTVALTQFGVAGGAALAAVLLYRAAELWLPLLAGISAQAGDNPDVRRASAHLPALMTAATGLLTVLATISRPFPVRANRLEAYSFVNPAEFSRTLAVVAGFLLLVLSWGLWRRKRLAWVAAFVVLGVSVVGHVTRRHDQVIGLLAVLNMLLLVAHRERFRVRSDIPTVRQGLIRAGLAVIFALSYGTLGFALADEGTFGREIGVRQALGRTVRLLVNLGHASLRPQTRFGGWFQDSLSLIGALTLVYVAVSLLRPVVWRRRTLPAERRAARRLIEHYGDASLSVRQTTPDKLYFFSHDRRAVVSFGHARASAIAVGDPVSADAEAFEGVLAEFLDFCDANDWSVAFYGVPETHLDCYRRHGLSAIKIGAEAIVDVEHFSLAAPEMSDLRAAMNQLEQAGYRAIYSPPPQPEALLAEVRQVFDDWACQGGRYERGFGQGQFEPGSLRSSGLVVAEDADGRIVAFAGIPESGGTGAVAAGLICRRSEAPAGVLDLLQVRLIENLRAQGVPRCSLGLVPLALLGEEPGSPLLERALRPLAAYVNRVFSYRTQYAFQERFSPCWEPRYLVYSGETALPGLVLAMIQLAERSAPGAEAEQGPFGRLQNEPALTSPEPPAGATEGDSRV